jgi:hypothetical protein
MIGLRTFNGQCSLLYPLGLVDESIYKHTWIATIALLCRRLLIGGHITLRLGALHLLPAPQHEYHILTPNNHTPLTPRAP